MYSVMKPFKIAVTSITDFLLCSNSCFFQYFPNKHDHLFYVVFQVSIKKKTNHLKYLMPLVQLTELIEKLRLLERRDLTVIYM